MKRGCKAKLADWLKSTMDLEIDQDALIDIQSLAVHVVVDLSCPTFVDGVSGCINL